VVEVEVPQPVMGLSQMVAVHTTLQTQVSQQVQVHPVVTTMTQAVAVPEETTSNNHTHNKTVNTIGGITTKTCHQDRQASMTTCILTTTTTMAGRSVLFFLGNLIRCHIFQY
jgi:hypothetical protein